MFTVSLVLACVLCCMLLSSCMARCSCTREEEILAHCSEFCLHSMKEKKNKFNLMLFMNVGYRDANKSISWIEWS